MATKDYNQIFEANFGAFLAGPCRNANVYSFPGGLFSLFGGQVENQFDSGTTAHYVAFNLSHAVDDGTGGGGGVGVG